VNRTEVADLRLCQLVATITHPGQRADIVHRDVQAMSVMLTADGESRPLPELSFRLPKENVPT